jgi:hypothetical protein
MEEVWKAERELEGIVEDHPIEKVTAVCNTIGLYGIILV